MFEVHVSKHSLFRLKIMVGCLTSTYPSIHVEDTLKITVGVLVRGCGVCGCGVLCFVCACGVCGVWVVCVHVVLCRCVCCVVVCCVGVGVWSWRCCVLFFLFSLISLLSLSFLFFPSSFFSLLFYLVFSFRLVFSFSSLPPPSSLLSLSSSKKEWTSYYRNISGEEFIFYYGFK